MYNVKIVSFVEPGPGALCKDQSLSLRDRDPVVAYRAFKDWIAHRRIEPVRQRVYLERIWRKSIYNVEFNPVRNTSDNKAK